MAVISLVKRVMDKNGDLHGLLEYQLLIKAQALVDDIG